MVREDWSVDTITNVREAIIEIFKSGRRIQLIGMAQRFLGEKEAAEDLVQEVLLAALELERSGSFKWMGTRYFQSWLFRRVRWSALTELRNRRIRQDALRKQGWIAPKQTLFGIMTRRLSFNNK